MANKYSYKRNNGPSGKPIIIAAASALAVVGGICGYLAFKANEDNKLAALRYDFNRYYPSTFNTVEVIDESANQDGDTLSNKAERELGTDIFATDTDCDGIIDSRESEFGTDPLNADTDGDGVKDGDEVQAQGLDPLNPMSNNQTPDKDRKFNIESSVGECSVKMAGGACIYSSTLEQLSLNAVSSNAGALTFPYEIYCEQGFDHADITFTYSDALVKAAEIGSDDIKVFRFDPYRKEYSEVPGSVVDSENCTVTCPITQNGVYVLGADAVIQQSAITDDSPLNVFMLIDNSGSMYPKSVQSTSKENDVDFKRLSFASKFVSELGPNTNVAISAFTYEVKDLCDFTPDKGAVMQSINQIRTLGAGFDGTSVERAIMLALGKFTDSMKAERNVIILLTDGISTDTAGYTLNQITAVAQAKNVVIMTISLGDEIDRELLNAIAETTGGKYFPISEANVLEGLYSTMIATMQNDIVDDDMDGTPDSYTLFDTGFDPDENGFSFRNFKSKSAQTLDFGMSMLARDWFKGAVKNQSESGDKNLDYTFMGTTIDEKKPLREVALRSMMSDYLNPDTYLDFNSTGSKLKVNSEEVKKSRDLGWSIITVPYTAEDKEWTEAEILVPDHISGTIRTTYSQNDYQMIRAIHYYDAYRDKGKMFGLNSETDLNRVKNYLGIGTPMVMKMVWRENGENYSRYVLLTTLRRSLDNPNLFKLKIYDVNDGSTSYVSLNRYPTAFGIKNGKQDFTYSAEWSGKQVSLSFSLAEAD